MTQTVPVNEWEAEPHEPLVVPAEILVRQQYRFSAHTNPQAKMPLVGTCARYSQDGSIFTLHDCLVDTSARVMGTLMKKRFTHRRELTFWGCPVTVFPFSEAEATPAPSAEALAADLTSPHPGGVTSAPLDAAATCPFCHAMTHADVRDCPEIDPEQLRLELVLRQPSHAVVEELLALVTDIARHGYVANAHAIDDLTERARAINKKVAALVDSRGA